MEIPMPLIFFIAGVIVFAVAMLSIPNPRKKRLEEQAIEYFERENREGR
jgi:hypothetical protein